MRLMLTTATALAITAFADGCGGGNGGGSVPTETTTTTAPSETTTIPWPPAGLEPDQTPVIRTPYGNIECTLDPSEGFGVVCNVLTHEWSLPPKPADCEFEWTDAVFLRATGRAEFWCSSNPAFGPPNSC
jgi:hypothetical protein